MVPASSPLNKLNDIITTDNGRKSLSKNTKNNAIYSGFIGCSIKTNGIYLGLYSGSNHDKYWMNTYTSVPCVCE